MIGRKSEPVKALGDGNSVWLSLSTSASEWNEGGGGVPQSANGLRNENQWENWTTWFGKRNFVIGGKRENIRSRQQEKMRGLQRIMALAEGSPRHGTAQ